MKKKAIIGIVVLAVIAAAALAMGTISGGKGEKDAEACLTLLFTASPEEQNDPQRFSTDYLEKTYRPLVTDDLWEAGLANRDVALLVSRAADGNCDFRPSQIQLEQQKGEEADQVTYLYTLTLEAAPREGGEPSSTQETGVLVIEKEDGRWLADYFRWNR